MQINWLEKKYHDIAVATSTAWVIHKMTIAIADQQLQDSLRVEKLGDYRMHIRVTLTQHIVILVVYIVKVLIIIETPT